MTELFLYWWQHLPEKINPYIIEVGSFRIGWYGLMYLAAFLTAYLVVLFRIKSEKLPFKKEAVEDIFVWIILGLILGARLGYVIIYNLPYYISHPLEIFLPFEFTGRVRYTGIAGMSYHGGTIGVVISTLLYCRKRKVRWWPLADLFAPAIPLGFTWGRIGNFINGELFGRATSVPWGMYFPYDASGALRHPSQLYEAFFEGIVLFAVIWTQRKKRRFEGFLLSFYIVGYGVIRFFLEFLREPDSHLRFIAGPFTMGQILCLLMIAAGTSVAILKRKTSRHPLKQPPLQLI